MWKFQESEPKHAERIGETFNRTRHLRRVLLDKYNGTQHPTPLHLRTMSVDQLLDLLMVNANQGTQTFESNGAQVEVSSIEAVARGLFGTHHDVGAHEKSANRAGHGQFVSQVPFPYSEVKPGLYTLTLRERTAICSAYLLIVNSGYGYLEAAQFIQLETGLLPPTGDEWTRHSARSFFQNAVHCGYQSIFHDRDKRGGRDLSPVSIVNGPVVSLETWLAANPGIAEKPLNLR